MKIDKISFYVLLLITTSVRPVFMELEVGPINKTVQNGQKIYKYKIHGIEQTVSYEKRKKKYTATGDLYKSVNPRALYTMIAALHNVENGKASNQSSSGEKIKKKKLHKEKIALSLFDKEYNIIGLLQKCFESFQKVHVLLMKTTYTDKDLKRLIQEGKVKINSVAHNNIKEKLSLTVGMNIVVANEISFVIKNLYGNIKETDYGNEIKYLGRINNVLIEAGYKKNISYWASILDDKDPMKILKNIHSAPTAIRLFRLLETCYNEQ